MKYIYFCDMAGDSIKEREKIFYALNNRDIKIGAVEEIEIQDVPNWLNNNEYFDVLFFDWGGMSVGNSMLNWFCREIIKHAENHPSRYYVMTSEFTKWAMQDAREEINIEIVNVFLCIDDFCNYIKMNG